MSNQTSSSTLPDPTKPFFAYGVFKEGELAWELIKKHKQGVKSAKVPGYYLGLLDGAAIMLPEEDATKVYKKHGKNIGKGTHCIRGDVLTFKEGEASKAFHIIESKEGMNHNYIWGLITPENSEQCNCLIANTEKDWHILDHCHPAPEDLLGAWSSKNDIMFTMNMIYLYDRFFKEYIDQKNDIPCIPNCSWKEAMPLFDIQMAYLSLFSIFNRYYKFRYDSVIKGGKVLDSPPPEMSEALLNIYVETKKEALEKNKKWSYSSGWIRSADRIKKSEFGDEDDFAEYFYIIRNNAIHRGKGMPNDFKILRAGFLDLYYYLLVTLYKNEKLWRDTYDEQYPGLMEEVKASYFNHLPDCQKRQGNNKYQGNRRYSR